MAILGPHGIAAHSVFTDALKLTFPVDRRDDVEAILRPFLIEAGATVDTPGLWRVPRLESVDGRVVSTSDKRKVPTVLVKARGQVLCVGFSGGTCQTLRLLGIFNQILAEFFHLPHRVTGIHATADALLDGPSSLDLVWTALKAGIVRLGRKTIAPGQGKNTRQVDARGNESGGVNLGSYDADVAALVYCKRAEMERHGLPDPGPKLRIELRLSVDGLTLRDAADPSALFWNYCGSLLTPPLDAPVWSAGDCGFMLEPRQERTIWERLSRRVEDWHDLQELALLSDGMGPYGRTGLAKLICRAIGVVLPDGAYWRAPARV